MFDESLEEIDKKMAQAILKWLEDPGAVTPAQVEAARKYLAGRGYAPPGAKRLEESGDDGDPRKDLGGIPQHVIDQFS